MVLLRETRASVLEICPTSNLLTGALADEGELRDDLSALSSIEDVRFTIATDGPEMMRTHLQDEFALLLQIDALTDDDIRRANARGHEATFVTRPLLTQRV